MSSAWYGRGALASEILDRLLRASGSRSAESTRRAARPSTSTSTPMFKKLPIRRSRRRPILVRRADSPRSSLGGATLTQQPRSSAVSLLSLTSSSPSVNVRPGEESSLSLMAWDEKPLKMLLSYLLSYPSHGTRPSQRPRYQQVPQCHQDTGKISPQCGCEG